MNRIVQALGWWLLVNLLIGLLLLVFAAIDNFWQQLHGRLAARQLIRSLERTR